MSITVLSPVGINMTEAQAIAPRIKNLDGVTMGLLNNNKPNSHLLQEHIMELLSENFQFGDVIRHQKPNAAVGAKGLDEYANQVQAVITAVGD